MDPDLSVRAKRGDPATLLPPVLELLKSEEGRLRRISDFESRKYATFFVQLAIYPFNVHSDRF